MKLLLGFSLILFIYSTYSLFKFGFNLVKCLHVVGNTQAAHEVQFIKNLSNTEVERNKIVAYKKSVYLN